MQAIDKDENAATKSSPVTPTQRHAEPARQWNTGRGIKPEVALKIGISKRFFGSISLD